MRWNVCTGSSERILILVSFFFFLDNIIINFAESCLGISLSLSLSSVF